mgnify:CR=1 FL=1
MAKLIYSAIASLDGYIADEDGNFEWAAPDEEVHRFVNDLERPVGTYLYGRRMYEVMRPWEHPEDFADRSPVMLEFAAVWQAADKVVYSRTLDEVRTSRTRLERDFDPAAVRAVVRLRPGVSAAQAVAARIGAKPLAEQLELLAQRARLELTSPDAGPPDRTQGLGEVLGLTPREAEVLTLLARGYTNREIAESLVISVRTAGLHVSHILRKLGVPNRLEAAAIAHRLSADAGVS